MQTINKSIVAQIGETDQAYLHKNTPELALERGKLRLALMNLSHHRQERLYFLHETIVILEAARIEFDEINISLYVDLSLELAKAYMFYYEFDHDLKFATITQQILRPLSHLKNGNIVFYLAYASVVKGELSLARHWLKKYMNSPEFDLSLIQSHSAFSSIEKE